jgi:hypothetical protein
MQGPGPRIECCNEFSVSHKIEPRSLVNEIKSSELLE